MGSREKYKGVSKKSSTNTKMIILISVVVFVIVSVSFILLDYFSIVNSPLVDRLFDLLGVEKHQSQQGEIQMREWSNPDVPDEYVNDYIDAETYFEDNGEIVSVVSVDDSESVFAENEVISYLDNKGFGDLTIYANYSLSGDYYSEVSINDSSDEMHPSYEMYYVNSSNEIWSILVIDGTIMAYPVSYNYQYSETVVPVIFSEIEEIVSYDSATNCFFRTIPDDDVMDVRVVDSIDSELLEQMTVEVIANG